MIIHRIVRPVRRCANGLIVLAGLAAAGAVVADVSEGSWIRPAVAASGLTKITQQRDDYIKTLPKHRQAKYYRLLGQQKPGHECFFTNKAYHVVWNGICQYNHAFDWESVSMFGQFSKKHDAAKAVDGRLDTWMNSKETRKADGIVWWELNLAKAVAAKEFVVVKSYGHQGGILAVSKTVRGDKLMTDKSGKVKRYYLGQLPGTFRVKLDGKPARHFRIYTHTAEWRRVKKIPAERLVTRVNNSPFYSIYEVYILEGNLNSAHRR